MIFPKRNTPRWIIFCFDITICLVSIVLAYLLRFNFNIPEADKRDLKYVVSLLLVVRILSFLIAKTYAGIIRYTSTKDAQRIFVVISLGSLVFILTNVFTFKSSSIFFIPFSIIIIDYLATVFLLISARTVVKVLYFELKNPSREKTKVIIYGAGEAGMIAKRALDRDAGTKYKVVAFIDDDEKIQGKKIEGTTIYNYDMIDELLGESVAFLIISTKHIKSFRKQQIIEKCLAYNVRVLNVPPVSQWINGELSFKQIKKINIEELLERDEIILDKKKIGEQIKDKIILITGAAGSIGSEIVRQVIFFNPKKIVLVDQAESPLYDLSIELRDKNKNHLFEEVIADISNHARMERVFDYFRPEIVFHAAAYKHVPLMESNPSEAIITNILGTKNIADLAVKYKVDKFVMISTDKAVNPTNVMGASKRAAEIYTQALGNTTKTKFITTRFGNVLGSNGSVIPLFKKQIEKGGPITLTHPDITRYFMTIPEACQLVLEAGIMGNGGEIFIFDMGKSVKIYDLAEKMIKLSGLMLHRDIEIVYTGLRPGEKLYEELLNNGENTIPTHHKQIMIAKISPSDFESIKIEIASLIKLFETQDNMRIVAKLKEIVPEYISNNSEFEVLDAK